MFKFSLSLFYTSEGGGAPVALTLDTGWFMSRGQYGGEVNLVAAFAWL